MNKDRVLIIGAQQSLTRLLKLTLPDEGFDVICHERPGDVRADRNDEDVDIIVVDFEAQSPRPDPAPICGALAQNQNGEHIPIVAISDEDPRRTRRIIPVDAALQTPFDVSDLARVMRSLLHRS